MKKIFLSVLFASAVLTGCSDAYDIHQAGTVTQEDQVFRSAEDIEKGIRYVYGMFPGEQEINFDSYFTDELGVGIGNAGQGVNDGSYTFTLTAGNSDAQAIWGSYYGVVNRLNRMKNRIEELMVENQEVLQADPENETASGELAKLKNDLAHIHILRAYCHYKLFAFFTPDYTDQNGLSVIKFDFLQTDDYSRFEKRATVGEIVSFIEDEIRKAKELLVTDQGEEGTVMPGGEVQGSGYASNEMMDAILIKMYSMLQTQDSYNKLEEAFNHLSETKNLANYITYIGLFGPEPGSSDSEGIFKLDRVSTDGSVQSGVAAAWYPAAVGDAPYMEMGRSLYNELDKLDPEQQGKVYNEDRRDLRYVVSVLNTSKVATNYASLSQEDYDNNDILLIGKYDGSAVENRPLMASLWQFRFTDMLLSLAEKRAFEGNLTGTVELNNYSNVESIIYNIRAKRNFTGTEEPVSMPTDFSSQKAAYARILEERRVEFAFEGQRYLDMKRLGVRAGSPGFVRDPQDCASTNACSLDPTSRELTMPIPRTEMVANPNMVQNPGY